MEKESTEVQVTEQTEAKTDKTEATASKTKAKKSKEAVVATYSIADFARKARKTHKVPPELVTVALRTGGKERYSAKEAKQIINDFLNKEVK